VHRQIRSEALSPALRCAETPGGFVVRDANGQALAYFYGHPTREAADIAKGLTLDETRDWR